MLQKLDIIILTNLTCLGFSNITEFDKNLDAFGGFFQCYAYILYKYKSVFDLQDYFRFSVKQFMRIMLKKNSNKLEIHLNNKS